MSLEPHAFDSTGRSFDAFLFTAIDNNQNTPDMPELMKRKHQLLFTYGTLKKQKTRSSLLQHAEFIGKAMTVILGYNLLHFTKGGYPIAIPVREKENFYTRAAVYGEVYLVPTETIPVLDAIENNGEMFIRRKRYVLMTSNKYINQKRPVLPVWMYEGVKSYWENAIEADTDEENFSACDLIIPKNKTLQKFYNY